MLEWRDKPTEPGWWWVWQPEDTWPCRGVVHCVRVDSLFGLEAQVPGMDYSDALTQDTWDGAKWQGPIIPPSPPDPG